MEIGHLGTGSFQYSGKLEETSEHRRKDTHRKVEKVSGGLAVQGQQRGCTERCVDLSTAGYLQT